MESSKPSAVLQAAYGCFTQAQADLRLIRSTENLFQENVAKVTTFLQKKYPSPCESQVADSATAFERRIMQHAVDLERLGVSALADARKSLQDEHDVVLQMFSNKLLQTIPSRVIKTSLASFSTERLRNCLPNNVSYSVVDPSTAVGVGLQRGPGIRCVEKQGVTRKYEYEGSNYSTRAAAKRAKTALRTTPQQYGEDRSSPSNKARTYTDVTLIESENVEREQSERCNSPGDIRAGSDEVYVPPQFVREHELDEQSSAKSPEAKAWEAERETEAKDKRIPLFVQQLSTLLDDKQNQNIIRWSETKDSFIIINPDEFSKKLIPKLSMQPSNYASFIRHLGIYGFHDRSGSTEILMQATKDERRKQKEYHSPFFRQGRLWHITKGGGNAPMHSLSHNNGYTNSEEGEAEGDGYNIGRDMPQLTDRQVVNQSDRGPTENNVLINFIDTKGSHVGVIQKPTPWSPNVEAILRIPVLRDVEVRIRQTRGPTLCQNKLAKVCQRSDFSASKLLACMIQAGGEIMNTPCTWCIGSQGPFEKCIMLSEKYSNCGNCQWTRHGCIGACNEWYIYKMKTAAFTSAASDSPSQQLFRYSEQEKCLQYLSRDNRRDFNISLAKITQVRSNDTSRRVQFTMGESGSDDTEEVVGQVVMVTFDEPKTVRKFEQFCKYKGLNLIFEKEPPEMVRAWMTMTSQVELTE